MLERMGALLKKERLRRKESQETFGARVGVHRHTLAKMERGNPEVRIEAWAWVLRLMRIDLPLLELMTKDNPSDREYASPGE
jgi:transcriptional regulator with XRE-family HTH domain